MKSCTWSISFDFLRLKSEQNLAHSPAMPRLPFAHPGVVGFEPRHMPFEIGCSSLSKRKSQNPSSLRLLSLSKHSNFENRNGFAESRASEKNGPFGEETADPAD